MILNAHGKAKQRLTITPIQIACILGLEHILGPHGLILTCPRCADEGQPQLLTENDLTSDVWAIDCQCRERRIPRTAAGMAMDADGELIANAAQILAPLCLTIRCGFPRCVRHILDVFRDGPNVIASCHCAKTTFRPHPHATH